MKKRIGTNSSRNRPIPAGTDRNWKRNFLRGCSVPNFAKSGGTDRNRTELTSLRSTHSTCLTYLHGMGRAVNLALSVRGLSQPGPILARKSQAFIKLGNPVGLGWDRSFQAHDLGLGLANTGLACPSLTKPTFNTYVNIYIAHPFIHMLICL